MFCIASSRLASQDQRGRLYERGRGWRQKEEERKEGGREKGEKEKTFPERLGIK